MDDYSELDLEAGNSWMNKTTYFPCMMYNNLAACSMDFYGTLLTSPMIRNLSVDSCSLEGIVVHKTNIFLYSC